MLPVLNFEYGRHTRVTTRSPTLKNKLWWARFDHYVVCNEVKHQKTQRLSVFYFKKIKLTTNAVSRPLSLTQWAELDTVWSMLMPHLHAVVMERVATDSPYYSANFWRVFSLAAHASVDDIVAANGAHVALHIPGPLECQVNSPCLKD